MKLKEYLTNLQNLALKYPELMDNEIIYSSDDEGNNYNTVLFKPTILLVEDIGNNHLDIISEKYPPKKLTKNHCVCIN